MATPFAALAGEASLEVDLGSGAQHLARSALLQRPEVRTITVDGDAAYHRSMQYRALPLSALLGTLRPEGDVQFTALDGFVANIPAKLLSGAGQPWLAIEPADAPWPALKPGDGSAGPFYLVWLTPQKAGVSPEQWPYQIAKIAAALPLAVRYPQITPKKVAADGPNNAACRSTVRTAQAATRSMVPAMRPWGRILICLTAPPSTFRKRTCAS